MSEEKTLVDIRYTLDSLIVFFHGSYRHISHVDTLTSYTDTPSIYYNDS